MVRPDYEKGVDTREAQGGAPSSRFRPGVKLERHFTKEDLHPYELIQWEKRTASITGGDGKVVFEREDVEFPTGWSQLATNVVVSKYFRLGTERRKPETNLRDLIDRVAHTITDWGAEDGYLAGEREANLFRDELTWLLVNQAAAFNSPVWFNVGLEEKPQCSACFINSVEDTMESILNLAKTEGMLFKFGSGTGTNFSPLRSSRELLSTGGTPSGPVSFMRGFDAFAGVIKSGGRTRRAAKMVILDVDHPDIIEFIECKSAEEKKAWDLIEAGYDGSFGGEAYNSVFFQNSNNSVRVSDEFMRAVERKDKWQTRAITDSRVVDELEAEEVMEKIAASAHLCGDPGLQFDTTINKWNTCKNSGRITASNPCSEYMFLNDSACNLASLNLMKFRGVDGTFDVKGLRQAVRIMLLAQEIIVDRAGYPSDRIGRNSHLYRPLGLGYANLGALLMSMGLPYDSETGNNYAATVTALMTGEAYAVSAEIAAVMGAFDEFAANRDPMLDVIRLHRRAAEEIPHSGVPEKLHAAARRSWERALELGEIHGYRNAQVTVLAPTGTIGFMMDCDTTGIEPEMALVKYKKLVGGGMLKIVNRTVPLALKRLGYTADQIAEIVSWIEEKETIEGAPGLEDEHLPVFDCAFRPRNGQRCIHYMGHLRMMGAVQPFLSGAISKTVNMPEDATALDIRKAYMDAWRLGLKAVAIYRENSKRVQPLSSDKEGAPSKKGGLAAEQQAFKPVRRRLPTDRESLTHKFSIAGHEGYITVGKYEDGTPGEVFVKMSKEGTVVSGLMDSLATVTSIALQYGVPLEVLSSKFAHTRFEPAGITPNPKIRFAKSIMDYIGRWLAFNFLPGHRQEKVEKHQGMWDPEAGKGRNHRKNGRKVEKEEAEKTPERRPEAAGPEGRAFVTQADAPVCGECGTLMTRNGACYKCDNCGSTSGCS